MMQTQWNEDNLSQLLGLDSVESSAPELTEPLDYFSEEEEVLTQSDLFEEEDPQKNRTATSFSNNPWSKTGLILGGLGVGFLVFGYFMNSIFNPSTPPTIATPPAEAQTEEPIPESEVGNLKTELALSNQAQRLNQISDSPSYEVDEYSTEEPIEREATLPEPAPTPVTSANRVNSAPTSVVPSTPRSIPSTPSVVPPRPTPVASHFTPPPIPPRPTSTSVTPSIAPPVIPPIAPYIATPRPTPTSVTPSITPPSSPSEDGQAVLARLQSMGSYGSGRAKPYSSASLSEPSTPEPEEVLLSSRGGFTPVIPRITARPLSSLSDEDLILNPSATPSFEPSPQIFPSGATATANLVTPIIWTNSESSTRFVVRLSEALSSEFGEVLPQGTEVVFELKDVHNSGLVFAEAVSYLSDGSEQPLAQGAISLSGGEKKPLVAQEMQTGQGEIASADLQTFVYGSLGKMGEILNRPIQESLVTTGAGGLSGTVTTRTGDANLLGAVLEGGFAPLTEQLIQRNQRRIQELSNREEFWFLPAGFEVEVQVNRSFEVS